MNTTDETSAEFLGTKLKSKTTLRHEAEKLVRAFLTKEQQRCIPDQEGVCHSFQLGYLASMLGTLVERHPATMMTLLDLCQEPEFPPPPKFILP